MSHTISHRDPSNRFTVELAFGQQQPPSTYHLRHAQMVSALRECNAAVDPGEGTTELAVLDLLGVTAHVTVTTNIGGKRYAKALLKTATSALETAPDTDPLEDLFAGLRNHKGDDDNLSASLEKMLRSVKDMGLPFLVQQLLERAQTLQNYVEDSSFKLDDKTKALQHLAVVLERITQVKQIVGEPIEGDDLIKKLRNVGAGALNGLVEALKKP